MNNIQTQTEQIRFTRQHDWTRNERWETEPAKPAQFTPVKRRACQPQLAPYLNRITLADCTTEMRKLPDGCVDLIVTDPPYLVRFRDRSGRTIANDDNSRWISPAFSEAYRLLKSDSYCISFYGWNKVDVFLNAWRECGFTPIGHFTWTKPYASNVSFTEMRHECAYLLAKGRPPKPLNPPSDVLPWNYSGNRLHPTQKPVSAITPLIKAYSEEGDIVLDPFAGSGTTGAAAQLYSRQFILFEMDPVYFEAANRRLQGGSN